MIGYFVMVDSNGAELGNYKFANESTKQKERLRGLKGMKFYCGCNDKRDLELKISKDFKLYPAKQNVGDQHNPMCPRYIEEMIPELWTIETNQKTKLYFHNAANYATAKDYLQKLNQLTYNRLTSPELKLPDSVDGFNSKVHITQKYIKTSTKEDLYSMCIANNPIVSKLDSGKEYFIYGELVAIEVTKHSDEVLYVDIKDCFDKRHRFYVERELYKDIYRTVGIRGVPLIAGGFVYKKSEKSKILTFSDFWVAPVSDLGIII